MKPKTYILDNFGEDYEEHKLATAAKESVSVSDSYYNWRFDWSSGWYNYGSSLQIRLVVNDENIYFELDNGSEEAGVEYATVYIYSRSCQHENMRYIPAVSPTCKKDGNGEYWYCPDCDNNGYAPYFSDADGIQSSFNPPVTMSYGAIDANHDGVCDDCGKNMPEFKKVTDESQIVAGGKYILVSQIEDKYYAASTGTEQFGNTLPAVEINPTEDGNFTFEGTTAAMTIELQFAHACTEWGNGIRYGFVTKFDERRSEFASMGYGEFLFDDYDIRGSKYGFYVGLNPDGSAKIHSAYDEADCVHAYTNNESKQFTFSDLSEDSAYTEAPVYLYRLTDTGTVNNVQYDMTSAKSETNYNIVTAEGLDAEGGTNVTGVADALTQTAVDSIVTEFTENNAVSENESVSISVGVNVEVVNYSEGESITFDLEPTATATTSEASETYIIPDSDFDGETSMTATIYVGEIEIFEIVHEKEDGTTETFYPDESAEVNENGEEAFQTFYDNNGNAYVSFDVTEFSNVKVLAAPMRDTENTTVNYRESLIYTTLENCSNVTELLSLTSTSNAVLTASYINGGTVAWGTGTIVTVYNTGVYVGDFTLVVNGDVNGDSVLDVLDCAQVEMAANNHTTIDGVYIKAVDSNYDDAITEADYQAIINQFIS